MYLVCERDTDVFTYWFRKTYPVFDMAGLWTVAAVLVGFLAVVAARHHHGQHGHMGNREPMQNLSCSRHPGDVMLEPEHICCYLNVTVVPCIVTETVSCDEVDNDDYDDYYDDDEIEYDDRSDRWDSDERDDSSGRDKRDLHFSWSWSWSWRNMCWRKRRTNCTLLFCTPTCCDGWRRDADGRCVVPESDTSQDVVCENGGTCMGTYCLCREGFAGKFCEIPNCKGGCGSGQCRAVDGRPECVCPLDFSGTNCQLAVCEEPCENGQCVPDGARARCVCNPGYSGSRCDIVMDKPGFCPSSLPSDMFGLCAELCSGDRDCPGIKKCCSTGCGHGCATPSNGTCTLENGRTIEVDQEYSPDACSICTCVKTGTVECRKIQCPRMVPAGCTKMVPRPGECCPVCDNTTVRPPGYVGPQILDCPKTIRTIQVDDTDNFAIVPDLKAIDFRGLEVKVNISPKRFKSCACQEPGGNLHRVTATTEMDEFGNFTNCSFSVDVQDRHKPNFKTCPAAITAWEDEEITWVEPEVEDNVGIARKDVQTPHEKGSRFAIGVHTVVIIAEDYDGNKDTCTFTVSIFEVDTEYADLPSELKRRTEHPHNLGMIVGTAVGGVVLILLVVIMAACCICRRRKMRAAAAANGQANRAAVQSYDNGLYSIYGKPPPYRSPVKTASMRSAPPMYEELSSTPTKAALEAYYQTLEQNRQRETGSYDNPVYDNADGVAQNKANAEKRT